VSHYKPRGRPPAVVRLDEFTAPLLAALATGRKFEVVAREFGTSRITLQNWVSWYESVHGPQKRRGRGNLGQKQVVAVAEREANEAVPWYGRCPSCTLRQWTREDAIRARIDGKCSGCPELSIDEHATSRKAA
jgi:hypothetical protein